MIKVNVNGKDYELDVEPDTPLLWVIRDHLNLPGTKYCCGIGECGACTVHINGDAIPSCSVTIEEVAGQAIVTIEGLKGKIAKALKDAWVEEDVPQCGYCQPGQIMTAADLLMRNPNPTDADINESMSAVLCRCGTYAGIRRAIHRASEEIRS